MMQSQNTFKTKANMNFIQNQDNNE